MLLFTEQQLKKLLSNGSPENRDQNHAPVIRLFIANTSMTWLLSELNSEAPHTGFGLCDLGAGLPELGYIDLEEIAVVCSRNGFVFESDPSFKGKYPMSVYAQAAWNQRQITTEDHKLKEAAQILSQRKTSSQQLMAG